MEFTTDQTPIRLVAFGRAMRIEERVAELGRVLADGSVHYLEMRND